MTFILETKGLSKHYGTNWALQDCTLQIPTGHVVGLVGPNGAGKTTLLHLAMGLLDLSAGFIQILGYSPQDHPREVLAKVSFVAQSRPLYKNVTVEQHLQFGARLNQRWESARAKERLAVYDIALNRKVGSLSGGQQAQVSFSDFSKYISSMHELLILPVLPVLVGVFIGAPLLAWEVEQGTYLLAWTQGITRQRWLVVSKWRECSTVFKVNGRKSARNIGIDYPKPKKAAPQADVCTPFL